MKISGLTMGTMQCLAHAMCPVAVPIVTKYSAEQEYPSEIGVLPARGQEVKEII